MIKPETSCRFYCETHEVVVDLRDVADHLVISPVDGCQLVDAPRIPAGWGSVATVTELLRIGALALSGPVELEVMLASDEAHALAERILAG